MATNFSFSSDNLARPNPNKCAPTEIQVSPDRLAFHLKLEGDRSAPQEITITNTGLGIIGIEKAQITAGEDDFVITNAGAVPDRLGSGQSFKLVVDFTARMDGQALGVLQIFTDEDRLPYSVELTSQTELQTGLRDLLNGLSGRLDQEILDRIAGDAALLAMIDQKITEIENDKEGDKQEQETARDQLEAQLRAYIDAQDTIERVARIAADDDLSARIAAIRTLIDTGQIPGIDQGVRDLLEREITTREEQFLIEKTIREQLTATLTTEITTAVAGIRNEMTVIVTDTYAMAQKIEAVEAKFTMSTAEMEAIASAAIINERSVWASATEVVARSVETLSGSLDQKFADERLARSAEIKTVKEILINEDGTLSAGIVEKINAQLVSESGGMTTYVTGAIEDARTLLLSDISAEGQRVESLLVNYATPESVSNALSQAIIDVKADVDGAYVTKTALDQAQYVTSGAVTTAVSTAVDTYMANNQGAYVTRSEITSAGYVTSDTINTAITTAVDEYMAEAGGSFVTRSEITEANYQSGTAVSNAIGAALQTYSATAEQAYAKKEDITSAGFVTAAGLQTAVVQQVSIATADMNGKLGVYWAVAGDAGNGRVAIEMRASNDGGPQGFDITGDVRINGNLLVSKTVTWNQINIGTMGAIGTGSWSGNVQHILSDTNINLPWNMPTLAVKPSGVFILDITANVVPLQSDYQNTNQQTGKTYYYRFVNDGGLIIQCNDGQGKTYSVTRQTPGQITLTIPVTSLQEFIASFTAALVRGNVNTTEDGGDYVTITRSNLWAISALTMTARWSAI